MKILIITQKVDKNDAILGFFHNWVTEFAKHCEQVTVICLYKGEHSLPDNVKILSLGKEERQSRLQYLIHFYWYIIHERKNYDSVFVHMNQIYVVLGGLLWRLWHKKISMWYTHRAVSMDLRIATILAHDIFTASKEGFNVPTKKLHIIGHGIDTELFNIPSRRISQSDKLRLVSVGRITRIKNIDTLIMACSILKDRGMDFVCEIVGPQVTPDDSVYMKELKELVSEKRLESDVIFIDAVSHENIREYYWKNDIHVNLTPTGGVDKAVLEGIVAGSVPLASNTAFKEVFGEYNDLLSFKLRDPQDLAQKIIELRKKDRKILTDNLTAVVKKNFGIESFINKILAVSAKSS